MTLRLEIGGKIKENDRGVLKISGKQGSEGCILPTYHHQYVDIHG